MLLHIVTAPMFGIKILSAKEPFFPGFFDTGVNALFIDVAQTGCRNF